MRLGLLGGTFDPIHCGHLDVAQAARRALHLDVVWLVPARTPPHRAAPRASASHRFAMVALAVAQEEGLQASDLEMDTAGPSYTVETLDRLDARGLPQGQTFFITGADAFRDIRSWKAYPSVLDRCHFVVVSRPGVPVQTLMSAMPEWRPRMIERPWPEPSKPGIFLVDMPTAPVSSTDVRQALSSGAPLDGLVPPTVAAHIARHGLYSREPEH